MLTLHSCVTHGSEHISLAKQQSTVLSHSQQLTETLVTLAYLVEVHLFVWRTFRVESSVDGAVTSGHFQSTWVFFQTSHCFLVYA